MTKSGFTIIPFDSSDEAYQKLYTLENSLDYHIKDWGTVEMLKYHASLIPEKCKPETNFLSLNNEVFGYGYTSHQEWAFDPTLLDFSVANETPLVPWGERRKSSRLSRMEERNQIPAIFLRDRR